MENLTNLKLTMKKIDTSMAEEYIKKVNESAEWPKDGQFVVQKTPENIEDYETVTGISTFHSLLRFPIPEEAVSALQKHICKNEEMFVQLEYLARGTDHRDVREHIKLMSQYLMCSSTLRNPVEFRFLYFTENTFLYNLVSVVNGFHSTSFKSVQPLGIVVGSKSMVPLCRFFVELCRDVGITTALMYANPADAEKIKAACNHWLESDVSIGCTGVIAERSDLDSAIDVFIESSVTAPWRLTQIYVQESIFEDFKDALAAKARVTEDSRLFAGDKTMLIECLQDGQIGIQVHGYRTTKELLTFIKTPYLSVWAAESAVSNEIALRTTSSTVWVNDYGSFDGPPRASLSVYNLFHYSSSHVPGKTIDDLKSWAKLNRDERFKAISTALKTITEPDKLPDIDLDLLRRRDDNFVHVTETTICFGLQKSGRIIEFENNHCFMAALNVLLMGNAAAIIGFFMSNKSISNFVTQLKKNGVPIYKVIDGLSNSTDDIKPMYPMVLEKFRVIRTNYGTIFAN